MRDRRCTYKVHVHQTPDSVLCPPVRANSVQERQARHWIAQICSGEGLQVGLLAATEKPTASTSTSSAFFAKVDSCDSLKIPRCSFPQLTQAHQSAGAPFQRSERLLFVFRLIFAGT
jgi:hypothetical protein